MNPYVRISLTTALAIAGGTLAFGPSAAQQQAAPVARYVMNVSTNSGMAGMMGGGAGNMMSMMFGGGANRESHSVELRLGSSRTATGTPQADHFPPADAKMGKALPLTSPTPGTPGRTEEAERPRQQFERPKGRLLIFWGCEAKAGPGQPVVIDFAKVAAGQWPANLFSARVPTDWGPSPSNSRTYGSWPNGKGGQQPGRGASLIGEHRVAGNYTPDIRFNLTQDFMPGIFGRASEQAGGATNLSWNAVTGATGYYAWAFGGKDMGGGSGDMVWWSSSAAREFGGGLWDWLPPATVRRLVADKVVLPPAQTSCTIPAEVRAAAPQFLMSNLYAYGPEANFAYPPRPANPATPWKPEWTTRVRYRSMTSFMIGGPDMGNMGGAAAQGSSDQPQPRKKCKKGGLGGLGGMLGSVLGGGDC